MCVCVQLSAEDSQRIEVLTAELAAAEKELAGLRKSASGLQVRHVTECRVTGRDSQYTTQQRMVISWPAVRCAEQVQRRHERCAMTAD